VEEKEAVDLKMNLEMVLYSGMGGVEQAAQTQIMMIVIMSLLVVKEEEAMEILLISLKALQEWQLQVEVVEAVIGMQVQEQLEAQASS